MPSFLQGSWSSGEMLQYNAVIGKQSLKVLNMSASSS